MSLEMSLGADCLAAECRLPGAKTLGSQRDSRRDWYPFLRVPLTEKRGFAALKRVVHKKAERTRSSPARIAARDSRLGTKPVR